MLSVSGDVVASVAQHSIRRLAFGSPFVRLDLVPSNFKVPSTSPKRSFFSWLFDVNSTSLAGVKTLGVLDELEYTPRNSDAAVSNA
jgi:hypothetical protein